MIRNACKIYIRKNTFNDCLNTFYNHRNVKHLNLNRKRKNEMVCTIGRPILKGVIWTATYISVKNAFTPQRLEGRCVNLREKRGEDTDMMTVLHRTKMYIENGNITEAERLLDDALKKSRQRQLNDWTNVFLLLLGKISLKKKDYGRSEKLYDELVGNLQKTLEKSPATHRLTLWAYIDLAQLYSETKRIDKAEKLYKQSMYDLEVMFVDAQDFSWAVETMQHVLDGYAHLLADTGRYKEALEQRENVHALYKTLFGEKHQKLVYNLNEFGRIYTYMGKDDEAIKYFSEAIELSKSVEMDQAEVCALYVNNGRAYMRKGILAKAKEFCAHAMMLAKQIDHTMGKEQANKCLDEIANVGL